MGIRYGKRVRAASPALPSPHAGAGSTYRATVKRVKLFSPAQVCKSPDVAPVITRKRTKSRANTGNFGKNKSELRSLACRDDVAATENYLKDISQYFSTVDKSALEIEASTGQQLSRLGGRSSHPKPDVANNNPDRRQGGGRTIRRVPCDQVDWVKRGYEEYCSTIMDIGVEPMSIRQFISSRSSFSSSGAGVEGDGGCNDGKQGQQSTVYDGMFDILVE